MFSRNQLILLQKIYKLYNVLRQIDNIILSGGAVKGFAHIGALRALEKSGIIKNTKRVAGTSIGSLFAFAIAINYNVKELEQFAFQLIPLRFLNFTSHTSKHDYSVRPGFNSRSELIAQYFYNIFKFFYLLCKDVHDIIRLKGIFDGNYIEKAAQACINAKFPGKNTLTFDELHQLTKINPIAYKDVYIPAADIANRKLTIFSYENFPEMPISTALQATAAFPILFKAVEYKGKFYSDGGLYSNLAIELFDNEDYLEGDHLSTNGANMRTVGVLLSEPTRTAKLRDNFSSPSKTLSLLNFLTMFVLSPLDAQDALRQSHASLRTIFLNTENIFLFNMFIRKNEIINAIKNAEEITQEYINNYIKNVKDPHTKINGHQDQINKIKIFILLMLFYYRKKACANYHTRFFKKPNNFEPALSLSEEKKPISITYSRCEQ